MNQTERRQYLIQRLIAENPEYREMRIPNDEASQRRMLRSLFNVHMPGEPDADFLKIQDEYLRKETEIKGITYFEDMKPIKEGIYLWQGDITTLSCDAI